MGSKFQVFTPQTLRDSDFTIPGSPISFPGGTNTF